MDAYMGMEWHYIHDMTISYKHASKKKSRHVFFGGLDSGQAPPKTLLLMLRPT